MKKDLFFSLALGATLLGFVFVLGHKAKPAPEAGQAAPGALKPVHFTPVQPPVNAPKPLPKTLSDSLLVASMNELAQLGSQVLEKIPTKNDLRGMTDEDVHQMAKPVFESSLQMKLYADQLEAAMHAAEKSGNVAEVADQGADFYEKCATREGAPESLRAVCFIEFAKLSAKSGHPENINRVHMPHEVIQIALEIAPSA